MSVSLAEILGVELSDEAIAPVMTASSNDSEDVAEQLLRLGDLYRYARVPHAHVAISD